MKGRRLLTRGERELISVALQSYGTDCGDRILEAIQNCPDTLRSIEDEIHHVEDGDSSLGKVILTEIKHLRRIRKAAYTLADFVQRETNDVHVLCLIDIPEQA